MAEDHTQYFSEACGGLQVITADVVEFDAPAAAFDRVMSIEMFEHMKNYKVRVVERMRLGRL